jgi:glucokinase
MVTVGTGIGGAIIDHGSVLHGASGSAADVGHMQIVPDGVECTCGGRGCLEQYASGRALVTKAREKCLSAPSQAALVLSLGDQTPEGIRGDHLTEAARRGDPLALECFEFIASWLGHGLSVLTAVLDPGCVVLGGGVSDAGNLLLEPTSAAYQRALPARDHRSPARLKLAQLGNDAGLIGAAHLAQAH